MRNRIVEVKKMVGRKIVKGKLYEYEFYTLPLNLYIPKHIVEKFGIKYIIQFDEENGTILIKPER